MKHREELYLALLMTTTMVLQINYAPNGMFLAIIYYMLEHGMKTERAILCKTHQCNKQTVHNYNLFLKGGQCNETQKSYVCSIS